MKATDADIDFLKENCIDMIFIFLLGNKQQKMNKSRNPDDSGSEYDDKYIVVLTLRNLRPGYNMIVLNERFNV